MKNKILILIVLLSVYSCSTITEKVTEIAEKENKYLSGFLNKSSSILVSNFGTPTQTVNENNQTIYVYEVKRKLFNCQRKFTIDSKNTVSGFVSTCWD
jgi:protoheme ferro-lyase